MRRSGQFDADLQARIDRSTLSSDHIALLVRRVRDAGDVRWNELIFRLGARGYTVRQILGAEDISENARCIADHIIADVDAGRPDTYDHSLPSHVGETARALAASIPFSSKDRFRRKPWSGRGDPPNPYKLELRWVKEFPVLGHANHFILQRHKARRPHFDLRLHCSTAHQLSPIICDACDRLHEPDENGRCSGLLSFAIPKGFDGMVRGEKRLAVETSLHRTEYSSHEGKAWGTTMLVDVGHYEVVTSASSSRAGLDRASDTPDWDEDEPGINHMLALGRCYRELVRPEPHRSFTVILHGERWHIRLSFFNNLGDDKRSKYRGKEVVRRQWIMQLGPDPETNRITHHDYYADTPMASRSLVTGRTMEEIEADRTPGGEVVEHDDSDEEPDL